MIWIQSTDEFDCLAKYDPDTGMLEKFSRTMLGENTPDWGNIAGSFSEMKGITFILFRNQGQIIFRVSHQEFVLDGHTIVNTHRVGNKRQLSIKTKGTVVFETEYELATTDVIQNDPTAFVEEEDADFGLFVSNISKDANRRDVLLGNLEC